MSSSRSSCLPMAMAEVQGWLFPGDPCSPRVEHCSDTVDGRGTLKRALRKPRKRKPRHRFFNDPMKGIRSNPVIRRPRAPAPSPHRPSLQIIRPARPPEVAALTSSALKTRRNAAFRLWSLCRLRSLASEANDPAAVAVDARVGRGQQRAVSLLHRRHHRATMALNARGVLQSQETQGQARQLQGAARDGRHRHRASLTRRSTRGSDRQ
jgi:hypothetical protein